MRGARRARARRAHSASMPRGISAPALADRAWEREWLKDFHAMRFGARLWICPRHEQVRGPDAVVVTLDPGLAFGTGTHPSTALCLDVARCASAPRRRARHRLWLRLGRARRSRPPSSGPRAVHCFDIDPQALTATARERRGERRRGAGARARARRARCRPAPTCCSPTSSRRRCASSRRSFARLVRPRRRGGARGPPRARGSRT